MSAIKGNELVIHRAACANVQRITLSGERQFQRLLTVRLRLWNILEMTNSRNGEQITGCQGLGLEGV